MELCEPLRVWFPWQVRFWLREGRTAQEAARLLCEEALRVGSHDNLSAVVFRFSSRPLALPHLRNSALRRTASEAVL